MKGYGLKQSNNWWLTFSEPIEVEGSKDYQVAITAHKDNVIMSYGDTAGTGTTPLHSSFDDITFGVWKVKSNALTGTDVGDYVPMMILLAYPYYHIYYLCSYGLGHLESDYDRLGQYIDLDNEHISATMSSMAYNQKDIMDGQSGRTLTVQFNTLIDPIIWNICYKANTTGWSQTDGWLNYQNPIYGIFITTTGSYNYDRYLIDASQLSDICIVNLSNVQRFHIGIFDSNKRDVKSIKEDLGIATTELNSLTETVEENTADIGDLSSRVSSIESETISKYVSR